MPGVQPIRAIEAPSGSLQRFPLSAGDAELAVAELRRISPSELIGVGTVISSDLAPSTDT